MNSKKIILDLCGGTGSWSAPYKANGYDVRVITLPEYDLLERTTIEGGGDCLYKTRRLDGAGRGSNGLRDTRRADVYHVLACEDDGENPSRPLGSYGACREMPPHYLDVPRTKRLESPLLGSRKPGRALAAIHRQTSAHVRPVRLRRYIHKENGFMGVFQRPAQKPPRTLRRGAGAVQDKQADFTATPGGLRNARGVERTSRPPLHDEQAFCRGVLQSE